jgi:predicted DNA repair protein MutK
MAGVSFLALLDDIATVLDDVAVLSKVAAKKSAGVLGDDLAVNAEQVSGVQAARELPVVWAVAKGSLINKAILVPAALLISLFLPWLITPLMVLGGLFLCYEGFEKLAHRWLHPAEDTVAARAAVSAAAADPAVDLVAFERDKIKGAIRTDFILSAEIIVITLGIVSTAPLGTRIGVLVAIALMMTVGVYGLVAGIVKLDDAGLHLTRRAGTGAGARVARGIGRGRLAAAPRLMRVLGVDGTAAMFLVGGGILTHALPALNQLGGDGVLGGLIKLLVDGGTGVVAGALVLAGVRLVHPLVSRSLQRLKGSPTD